MPTQIPAADLVETDDRSQANEDSQRAQERLSLERLALISDDRSRLSPRSELDILALTGTGAGSSDWAEGRL